MKKVMLILAVGVTFTLTACGSGSTTTETKDSSVAVVDSTSVVPSDSVVAPVGGGSTESVDQPVSNEAIK